MKEGIKITLNDIQGFRINREDAIELLKRYAIQYKGNPHFTIIFNLFR